VNAYSKTDKIINIGVYCVDDKVLCSNKWQPTASYLTESIDDYEFKIIALNFNEIFAAIQNRKIEFVLVNSAIYVGLEKQYGISRIATIKKIDTLGRFYNMYGGVVFTLKERHDINTLDDLYGKTISAVGENSLGGWLSAKRELLGKSIFHDDDFKSVFTGTNEEVVYNVVNGNTDAGTARTEVLEKMHIEKKIDLNNIKIINRTDHEDFPYLCSTRLYPEWPISKLKNTSIAISDAVSRSLINMPENSNAAIASKSGGWTIPENYQTVHDCLKELKIFPYNNIKKNDFTIAAHQNRFLFLTLFIFLTFIVCAILYLYKVNKRLNLAKLSFNKELNHRIETELNLIESKTKYKSVFDHSPNCIIILDNKGKIVDSNYANHKITNIPGEEILGKYIWDLESLSDYYKYCFYDVVKRISNGENYITFESEVRIDNSKTAWFDNFITPIVYSDEVISIQVNSIDITDRKISEIKLNDREKRLQTIFDNSPDSIIISDYSGNTLDVSSSIEKLTGFSKKEIIGKHFKEVQFLTGKSVSSIDRHFEMLNDGTAPDSMQFEIICKDGSYRWAEAHPTVFSTNDESNQVQIIVRDITERKYINEKIRTSEEKYRTLFERSVDCIYIHDFEGNLIDANPAALTLFDIEKEEIFDFNILDILYKDYHDKFFSSMMEIMENYSISNTVEFRITGKERIIQTKNSLIFRNDKPYAILCIARDITEFKKQESYKNTLASIVEHSDDAIIGHNLEGEIISWNSGAEYLFGYKSQEVLGRNISFLVPDENKCVFEDALKKHLNGEYVDKNEIAINTSNNIIRDVMITTSAIRDDNNIITGASSIFRDITEMKKMDRLKNEFISNVSHELRTPLTSLRGSLGLITNGIFGSIDDEVKEMLDIACNNTDRLVRLINDLLDLQKIKSGKSKIVLENVNISDIVKTSISEMDGLAKEKKIELECNVVDEVIKADSDRILQVFDNLLSNAIKFSPDNETIAIDVCRQDDMIISSISDNGIGIPDEFKDKLFNNFQQVDGSSTRNKGGTGLGLSISKAIVTGHGGEIWFESELGKGTTVYFTLKCNNDSQDSKTCSNNNLITNKLKRNTNKSILIVDDEQQILNLLNRIFSREGFKTYNALNGEEAKIIAEQNNIDAIILDIGLPDISGLDLLKYFKENKATKRIPVIFLSGSGPDEFDDISYPPVIDWLTKPVQTKSLVEAVYRATRDQGPPRVLIIDDDDELLHLLGKMLESRGILSFTAKNGKEGFESIKNSQPDLIILDVVMENGDGFYVAEKLKNSYQYNGIPVAVYSCKELSEGEINKLSGPETYFFTKLKIPEDVFINNVIDIIDDLNDKNISIKTRGA